MNEAEVRSPREAIVTQDKKKGFGLLDIVVFLPTALLVISGLSWVLIMFNEFSSYALAQYAAHTNGLAFQYALIAVAVILMTAKLMIFVLDKKRSLLSSLLKSFLAVLAIVLSLYFLFDAAVKFGIFEQLEGYVKSSGSGDVILSQVQLAVYFFIFNLKRYVAGAIGLLVYGFPALVVIGVYLDAKFSLVVNDHETVSNN